jgi:NADH-quinone oxidoreductase subunit L
MSVPGIQEAWLLPVIPLGAFAIISFLHNYLPRKGDWVGILAILASFVLFWFVLIDALHAYPTKIPGVNGYNWITAGTFRIDIGFYVDQIALVMLFVVTTVALMVNIYSVGYMHGEARYGWFFAALGLFAFSMMMLVLADNLLLLYAAWELVGICSFLLIGFYWERRSAAEAAKKAFVTTRIGDVGMLIGIILLWRATGTFNIQAILHAAETGAIGSTYLTVAALFLFLGPVGKSAQVPLHVWLPDAMEGPTPVSALIHAATMVVAGIYLVARMLPLFEAADIMIVILTMGMITALFGATVALAQTDIKKVIAYSTISNLGIMMVALGVGSVTAAMFHLMTHAFFKADLFLGSGSVIHATHTQEMGPMGGLRKKMPITTWSFVIAGLANAGLIPLAGFWSKEEITAGITEHAHAAWFYAMLFWILISGMYTARLLWYPFFGKPRDHHAYEHAHESPFSMTFPLIVLGALSVVTGFLIIPDVAKAVGLPFGFGSLVYSVTEGAVPYHFNVPHTVASTLCVVGGLLFAYYLVSDLGRIRRFTAAIPELYNLVWHKLYFDEMYQWLIDRVILVVAFGIAWFDRHLINDTGVDGTSNLTGYLGFRLKFSQTGRIPNYALAIVIGVITLAVVAFSIRT